MKERFRIAIVATLLAMLTTAMVASLLYAAGEGFSFDYHVSLGSVLTIATFLLTWLSSYIKLPGEVRRMQEWRKRQDTWVTEKNREIKLISNLVIKMNVMIQGQDKRIELLEDRFPRRGPVAGD